MAGIRKKGKKKKSQFNTVTYYALQMQDDDSWYPLQ